MDPPKGVRSRVPIAKPVWRHLLPFLLYTGRCASLYSRARPRGPIRARRRNVVASREIESVEERSSASTANFTLPAKGGNHLRGIVFRFAAIRRPGTEPPLAANCCSWDIQFRARKAVIRPRHPSGRCGKERK